MALINYIDGSTRRIYLSVDTMNTAWHPVDLYREVRSLRKSNEELRKYNNFIKGDGNIDKGGGKATERYFTLLEGTRIVPYDASHVIDVTGTLITDDGYEGAFCFDKSLLTPGVSVDIQYAPKQVEVINLNFDDLVYSSFQNAVWLDVTTPYSDAGSNTLPNGNRERPVNNIVVARQIAIDRGFDTINVIGALTLGAGDDVSNFTLQGSNPTRTMITIEDAANTAGCEIKLATVTGTLDGGTVLRECLVLGINYVNGFLDECVMAASTITLGGNAAALFMRCLGRSGTLTIDVGGSGQALEITDYNGRLKIINKTGTDDLAIHMSAGRVEIDPTVVNGVINLDGIGKLKHIQTGSEVIVNEMLNGAEVSNIQRLLELQRSSHSALGNIWYWDPFGGNDSNDGDHITRGVKTFAQAQELATSGRGDLIIALSTNPSGTTITNENITMYKDDLMLRGQGESFEIRSSNDSLDGVLITGHGCEISSLTLGTSNTSTSHCVRVSNSNTLIKDIILTNAVDGIMVDAGEYTVIKNIKAHHNLGTGIEVSGTAKHTDIIDCHIGGNGGDGIRLTCTDPHEVVIGGNTVIHKNTGYGIYIGSSHINTTIEAHVSVFLNTAGNIEDLGTNTYNVATENTLSLIEAGVATKQDVFNASQI